MDTYGPVSDNAQGIAEMSGEFEGRPAEILASLDAVGNSTKAITKGMAIATAVIAATSLFGSFEEALRRGRADFVGIRIDAPDVLVGLLIGGAVPFLFCSLAIRAVGRAAAQVVQEVRKQFREHPGIMDYTEKPDYARVVDICTADLAAGADDAGPARGAVADLRRVLPGGRGARRVPGRRDPHRTAPRGDAVQLRAAPGTTPRSTSRRATTAARAARPTRLPSSATRSATRSRTPPAPPSTR